MTNMAKVVRGIKSGKSEVLNHVQSSEDITMGHLVMVDQIIKALKNKNDDRCNKVLNDIRISASHG